MSGTYASGKHSNAICDRCGFQVKYHELHKQYVNRVYSGLKVCSACLDIDHEQLQVDLIDTSDPQALRDPRPELEKRDNRATFGWNPVGDPVVMEVLVSAGTVTAGGS